MQDIFFLVNDLTFVQLREIFFRFCQQSLKVLLEQHMCKILLSVALFLCLINVVALQWAW